MDSSNRILLEDGINQICFFNNDLNSQLNKAGYMSMLEIFHEQIDYFNPIYNLVKADEKEIIIRHFLDSMAPFAFIIPFIKSMNKEGSEEYVRIADFGSGAGFPGMILAFFIHNLTAFNCNTRFFLVERMGRRAGFLRTCSVLTGVTDNLTVLESDISELNDVFDIITMRAFRPLAEIYKDLLRTTVKGSKVIIYKTSMSGITDDIAFVKTSDFSVRAIKYWVPFLDAERSLLVLTRI